MADEEGTSPRKRRPSPAPGSDRAEPPGGGYGEGEGDGESREPVEAHAAFVAAHFGGGAEATPELFDRAIDVWQRMPGAVVCSAPLLRPKRPEGRDVKDETS